MSYCLGMGPCDFEEVPNESSDKPDYHPVALPNTHCTMMPSKVWNTKHPDALATGQSWYCWRWRKYLASWGVVIEMMTLSGELLYARADCPPTDVLDIRAMKIESEMPDATAEEIYNNIPVIPAIAQRVGAPAPDNGVLAMCITRCAHCTRKHWIFGGAPILQWPMSGSHI